MIEPAPPDDRGGVHDGAADADADADDQVIVVVVRSGGLLGRSTRWVAEPPPPETDQWVTLIERCPWQDDTLTQVPNGADRYMWLIRATLPGERHERELPDAALDGPWRDLVDAVRETPGSRVPPVPAPQPGRTPQDPAGPDTDH